MADQVTIVIESPDEVAVIVSQGEDMLKTTYDPTGVNADCFDRSNHIGTQTASTISDFDTEVSNNTDVAANTSARHTHSNKTILDNTTASYTTTEQTKLAGIEAGATADQTASEIKSLYESNSDTNAFTDAEKSKLAGIEAGADVTDAANVNAAGATMNTDTDVSSNAWVVTDASSDTTSDTTVPTVKKVSTMIGSGGVDPDELLSAIKTVDGSGSGLDADLLDGHDSSYFLPTTGNAASASKLATARTIALGGDCSGSASFDGSANVTISATVANDSHTHDGRYYTETESDSRYLGKTATATAASKLATARSIAITGDVSGSASFDGTSNIEIAASVSNDSHTHDGRYYTEAECDSSFLGKGDTAADAAKLATARTISLGGDCSGSASFDGTSNITITATVANDSHTHDTRYYTETESDDRFLGKTANAVSASKWATARTLSLGGDCSGSVSIDGSANKTLTVTVANDSHTHDGRYYTETECNANFAPKATVSTSAPSGGADGDVWYRVS